MGPINSLHAFLTRKKELNKSGMECCVLSLKNYIKTQQVKHECAMEKMFAVTWCGVAVKGKNPLAHKFR